MVYVEWVRVARTLRVCAIVLGVLFLLAGVVRLAMMAYGHDSLSWVARMKADPGSKISELKLPDGTTRTTIDTPDGQHIVVDDHGSNGKHVEIWDPKDNDPEHDNVELGSVQVHVLPKHGGTLTVIDTNGTTPFLGYIIFGTLMGLIVATILGAAFARENDGHLEIAFLRPASRLTLALQTIGVDVAGIAMAVAMGIVFAIVIHALFEVPNIVFDPSDVISLGLGLMSPLAVYALIAAATASMKRGSGLVLGFMWPIMLVVVGLAAIPPNLSALAAIVHYVFGAISILDPLTYMHFAESGKVNGNPLGMTYPASAKLGFLALLAAAYLTAAVFQWRRIEA